MSSSRKHRRVAACAVAVLLLMAPLAGAVQLKPGDPLPVLQAGDFEGALPEMAGKVVLLDFWASWCGPCKASFPELDKLHRTYAARGFLVLGVSVDERPEDMKAFLEAHPVSFPTVRDRAQTFVRAVEVDAMPTSLLIDRQGRVVKVHSGYHGQKTVDELEAEISKLLGEP